MKRIFRNSGFTVVEVLIFSVVSLMFIGLLAQVFISATRRTEDARLRVDIQQQAVMVLKKFERDINKTSANAMAASDDSNAYVLAMTRVQSWNNSNEVNWRRNQIVWAHDKSKKELFREVYPEIEGSAAPLYSDELIISRPYLPPAAELVAVFTAVSGVERRLSPYVEEFWLADRTGRKTVFQTQPLSLRLKVRRPLSTSERFAEFTVERLYALRNSF